MSSSSTQIMFGKRGELAWNQIRNIPKSDPFVNCTLGNAGTVGIELKMRNHLQKHWGGVVLLTEFSDLSTVRDQGIFSDFQILNCQHAGFETLLGIALLCTVISRYTRPVECGERRNLEPKWSSVASGRVWRLDFWNLKTQFVWHNHKVK